MVMGSVLKYYGSEGEMVVVDLAITREGAPWQSVSSRYYEGVAPGDLISHPGSDQNQHRKCPRHLYGWE